MARGARKLRAWREPAERVTSDPEAARRPSWAGTPTTSYVEVACRLKAALGTLPLHEDDIARMLHAHRIRGYTCRADCDPLALYLTTFIGHAVYVGSSDITADEGLEWSMSVGTPRAVRMFLTAFDAGEYPNLVLPEN